MIVGSHKYMYRSFAELQQLKGKDMPFPVAIYNYSRNEQHSGQGDGIHESTLTKKQIEEFNIKYI